MPALVTFGRVLFAVLFMYTGATKLFAIQQTADFIATKVTIPALLAPYTSQLETMTGMPMPQLLAMGVGGFEVLYPVNEVAAKHDASVLEETSSPDEAYARWGKEERSTYDEAWLPS